MPVLKRRRGYAVVPKGVTAKRRSPGESDPDPVAPQHYMFVLAWQVEHPGHQLADIGTDKLARMIRDMARRAINEAIAELEEDNSAEQHTLLDQELAA